VNIQVWAAFVLAAAIVLVIPGPTILLVISQAISHGRKAVMPLVAGVTLGDFTAMTLSLLGLGAILSASAAFFSVLKGATFLFLATFNAALYALFAGQLRDKLQNSTVRRWLNRCGGSVLICAGLATATLKRSS
jgi:threonine/homoserine/homoserine lactone efflux protein